MLLPRWHSGKEFACQCKSCGFDPWVGKILWSRRWQPTPVFLLAKFHGQRRLVSYSPWGCKGSDKTEHTHTHIPVAVSIEPLYVFYASPGLYYTSAFLSLSVCMYFSWMFKFDFFIIEKWRKVKKTRKKNLNDDYHLKFNHLEINCQMLRTYSSEIGLFDMYLYFLQIQ